MKTITKKYCGSLRPSSWPTAAIDHNSVRHFHCCTEIHMRRRDNAEILYNFYSRGLRIAYGIKPKHIDDLTKMARWRVSGTKIG